jgi:APA family basic amino acid/polyamine antiporter
MPDAPRPYKTFGYPIIPLIFVLVAGWLIINTLIEKPVESIAGLVLILIGIPLYLHFRRQKPRGVSVEAAAETAN